MRRFRTCGAKVLGLADVVAKIHAAGDCGNRSLDEFGENVWIAVDTDVDERIGNGGGGIGGNTEFDGGVGGDQVGDSSRQMGRAPACRGRLARGEDLGVASLHVIG